jgi:tight adherence protein C
MYSARAIVLVIVTSVACMLSFAQPGLADDPLRIRITSVDASAFPDVRVVASVVDAQDRPLADLTARDLVVSEDGRPQSATADLANEFAPVAVALVLDTSGSMAGRPLADAKAAMTQLIRTLAPKDQGAVLTFNTSVKVDAPLTTDKNALVAATDGAVAAGNTAIFDAVARAIDVLASTDAQARRAIVILTDGVDNSSTVSRSAVLDRVRAQGYPIYVVGLGADLDRPTLQSFADASRGGQAFVAPTSAQLASIYSSLSARIATQYLVSYHSNVRSAAEGASLTLTLQVVRAGSVLGTGTATFAVPVGHAVTPSTPTAAATVEPAPAVTVPAVKSGEAAPYSAEVVGLLGTAAVLSLLLWVFGLVTTHSLDALERRRIGSLASEYRHERGERVTGRSFNERIVRPLLARLGRRIGRLTAGSFAQSTELRLAQAGGPLDIGAAEFIGLQLGAAFTGAAVFSAIAVFTIGLKLGWILLIGVAGAFIGIIVPNIWLDRAVKARRRKILRALPSALDMLAMSARAGLTFDGAISQVVQRWDSPLSEEFRRVLADFRIGRDRRETLRAMAKRTGVLDVMRFANAMIQADALGVPISKVLLDQSVEMRTRRRQRAEESARIAPVKMLFPMVGLIFPALFVVILGPAVPRFLQLFAVH